MNIRGTKQDALQRLGAARGQKKIVQVYALLTVLSAMAVTLISTLLDAQIGQTGGLGNLGSRAMLSTILTALPLVQALALMCLDLGYRFTILRIVRRQSAEPGMMKEGFSRFWPMLRMTLAQSGLYLLISFAAMYVASNVFFLTPWAARSMELLLPYTQNPELITDLRDADYWLVLQSILPMIGIWLVLTLAVLIPVSYQYRMASYVLLDMPRAGALFALRESRHMMRGNRFWLFKLDVSLWWYYALMELAALVCYGDALLLMLGVTLPWSTQTGYYVFYGLYLVLLFAIYYYARNGVEAVYATAYEYLRPKPKDNGVVLGNIFQM